MTFANWYANKAHWHSDHELASAAWNAAIEEAAAMCRRMATMQGLSEAMRGSRYACADAISALEETT